ncbi:MAG TPA: hypothetical protein EYP59_04430 [Thiotrichaceae bacterium]|nr:hypothetical protein [Thiotrichaceae bacterium]
MKNKINLKKSTAACTLLLATGSAWGSPKLGTGQQPSSSDEDQPQSSSQAPAAALNSLMGKNSRPSPVRIEAVTLNRASEAKIRKCTVPKGVTREKSPKPDDIFSLSFDPKQRQKATLQFEMAELPPTKEERVLMLLYSRCLTRKPKIKTPLSKHKLALDTKDLEVMTSYNVPADSTKGTQVTFEVDLRTAPLKKQVNAGNDTFYFQVALINKSDFQKGNYGVPKLSPLQAIHATSAQYKLCPEQNKLIRNLNSDNESCKNMPGKTE